MTLEEMAKFYQDGGEFLPEAKAIQNQYIIDNIEEIFKSFAENMEELDMRFEDYVNLKIGLWQAENGFARPLDLT